MKFRQSTSITLKPELIIHSLYPCKCIVELIEPDPLYMSQRAWKCRIKEFINSQSRSDAFYVGGIKTVFRHEFADKNWKPYFKSIK